MVRGTEDFVATRTGREYTKFVLEDCGEIHYNQTKSTKL